MPSVLSVQVRSALASVVRNRSRAFAAGAVILLLAGVIGWVSLPRGPGHRTTDFMIEVRTGPGDATTARLDATLYLPSDASTSHRVPAILLAHGFGGSKFSVTTDAQRYADRGYAVLAWTAQGFGRSGGQVHLNSPDWEVRDAQRLIDWLAARPEIAKSAEGDPRVAVVGASYGGALALMLAAADHRVDAIVPMITWNDLARSLLPESTGRPVEDGVFKRQWAGLFFGSASGATSGAGGAAAGAGGGPGAGGAASGGARERAEEPDPQCGRFARDICDAYLRIATRGRADAAVDAEALALLRRSSPAAVIGQIKAPTLLIQGTADSLFPLSEADANARGIAANGTPVRVAWYVGGHDGGEGPASDVDRLRATTDQWLDHYVRGRGAEPERDFTYSRVTGLNVSDRGVVTSAYSRSSYPGIQGSGARRSVTGRVTGDSQPIANPPAGNPAALSSLPGTGTLASFVSGVVVEVPGQHADFYSEPLDEAVTVVGSPTVTLLAASQTGEAVLFVKLYDAEQAGSSTLPDGLIAPVRLTGLPKDLAQAQPVTVLLPAIVHRFEPGHMLRVTVSTSDQAYATPREPAVYTVAVGQQVTLPTVDARQIPGTGAIWWYVLAGLATLILVCVVVAVLAGRRVRAVRAARMARTARTAGTMVDSTAGTGTAVELRDADIPLLVRALRKEYDDGFIAVETADFAVQRNTVVGLLGPNGAGKTTTLRVLLGLTRPTAGEVLIFGEHLVPGSPVLRSVGALVEGPGFLPHLSGLANLTLYWQATGRPAEEARIREALDIAGLGDAVHRKTKTYSHGMRQRLAIAQAMLGLPDLLILDEPTDGLDPPQIAEMRTVLREYATDGRSVLVSSHLLAEVEQTCTHVVVMHKGLVVANGAVESIVGDSPTVVIEVSDPTGALAVLDRLPVVKSVVLGDNRTLIADLDGASRSEVVAALVRAGIGVERLIPRRRLEDAFLALVGGDTKASGERL